MNWRHVGWILLPPPAHSAHPIFLRTCSTVDVTNISDHTHTEGSNDTSLAASLPLRGNGKIIISRRRVKEAEVAMKHRGNERERVKRCGPRPGVQVLVALSELF